MPKITLPDGSQRDYPNAITVAQVAADIGAGLAKAALAGNIDEQLVDLSYVIQQDCKLAIITEKNPESLAIIRHSTAHLLAQAVKQLFPQAQITIGPVIEDGFYYDISYPPGFNPQDLLALETRMTELAKQDLPVKRITKSRSEAVAFFKELGEFYKAEIIASIPSEEDISLYQQGDFTDLCRGPHVPNTGKLKAFKLMKLAGAYWRGDSKNEMLQRIYGTAWHNKNDLDLYLERLSEAEKRDHRKLAKTFDLFHIQDEAPGMVFWHPNGWQIYQTMQQYIRDKLNDHGYQEVRTPIMADRSIWEKSGHWAKYQENMFVTESENRVYAVKPMSCPFHVQIFNQGLKSYRDLPLRLAEFGICHRNEASGTLHGLMRVRNFVQDDAHIFCTPEQIFTEVASFIKLLKEVYADFGFTEIKVLLSTRPINRMGSDELWDKAEADLTAALNDSGLPWKIAPGDGAFYGPKIDFSLNDCIGRTWQLGTLQLDYQMPERLGASYVSEDGNRQIPVMLHRAIIGTFERFMGILIENYAGKLPLWLAPKQAVILNITDNQHEYAHFLAKNLKKHGFRIDLDLRNEKIGFKIREHTLQRVPYLIILGDREVTSQTVSVRTREGEDLGSLSIDELCTRMKMEIDKRSSG